MAMAGLSVVAEEAPAGKREKVGGGGADALGGVEDMMGCR